MPETIPWIDILFAAFVVRGIVIGYRRGFSGELLHFIGIICGLVLSLKFCDPLAGKILQRVAMERNIAVACAFTVIFFAVLLFFYMINQTARGMMQVPVVAALEKAGGAALGGAKALLFASAIVILLALARVESLSNAVRERSYFGRRVIAAAPGAIRKAMDLYPKLKASPVEDAAEALGGAGKAGAPGSGGAAGGARWEAAGAAETPPASAPRGAEERTP